MRNQFILCLITLLFAGCFAPRDDGPLDELPPLKSVSDLAADQSGHHFIIMYSSDLRGDTVGKKKNKHIPDKIFRRASLIDRMRKRAKQQGFGFLAIDAGNLLFPAEQFDDLSSEKVSILKTQAQNAAIGFYTIGYNSVALGYNDMALGLPFIEFLRDKYDFEFMNANIVSNATVHQTLFPPSVFAEIDGVKLGLFALIDRNLPAKARQMIEDRGFLIEEPIETCKRMNESLRKDGASYVVALAHQQWAEQIKLAGNCGVDLVVAGKGEKARRLPHKVNNNYVVQTADTGNNVGELHVVVRPKATSTFDASMHLESLMSIQSDQQFYQRRYKKKQEGKATRKEIREMRGYKKRIQKSIKNIQSIEEKLGSEETKKQHLLFNKMFQL